MNHILWFRDQVKKGGPWDYNHSRLRTPEEIKSSVYDITAEGSRYNYRQSHRSIMSAEPN